MIQGIYIGCTAAELATMRADAITLLSNLRKAHQSYTEAGKTISRVQMADAQNDLAEINYAQGVVNGTSQRTVYSDFSNE